MLPIPTDEKSYWRSAYKESLYQQAKGEIHVDVGIIGGGITGLTAAYLLKQAGLKVAVLEKRTVGAGTTGRTTGKVTSQHNIIYTDLVRRLGDKHALNYAHANQSAVEMVAKIIKKEKINCEWTVQNNYVYTVSPQKVRQFKQEAETAAKLDLPASFETSTPLPFAVTAAVVFSGQGRIHSQKYLLGLADAVNRGGSYVYEYSKVIGIRDGEPCRLLTAQATIYAKDIIVATSVPTLPLLARGGYCLLEYPTESYIIAGRYTEELPGMYISPDKDQYSILPVLNSDESLLLIGGNSHLSGLRLSKTRHYKKLVKYAQEKFGITEIAYRWSDRDYLGYDGIPLAGKLYPWSKHLYVGSAYRKWGLSNGTASAMILTDIITGQENQWAETYNPIRWHATRSIPHAVTEYIKH